MIDAAGLRVMRAIADEGSFTAAALSLGYSQPAISQMVRRLETRTGTTLVERVGRSVRLTEAGAVLARQHARVAHRRVAAQRAFDLARVDPKAPDLDLLVIAPEELEDALTDVLRSGPIAPEIAVGDGALGFWKALDEIYPGTRHQRCWVHKTANVLNKVPRAVQATMKVDLRENPRRGDPVGCAGCDPHLR